MLIELLLILLLLTRYKELMYNWAFSSLNEYPYKYEMVAMYILMYVYAIWYKILEGENLVMCDIKYFYVAYHDCCTPKLSQYDNYHNM